MSSVERGLGGVWSCLYCEGTWLPQSQADALSKQLISHAQDAVVATVSTSPDSLVCPTCQGPSFEAGAGGISGIHGCMTCSSLFLEKGVLAALSPQAFSLGAEAPLAAALVGILGSALALDPLPLALALQAKREKNRES